MGSDFQRKNIMKNETAKAPKVNKKALIAEIEKMGIDQKITNSLARSNIETIQFVKSLLLKS
jgi:hypothetical protein|tara:strand:- start:123 stop:308 length:186 start_codon:yes stop_codon:yes gene_type:complete